MSVLLFAENANGKFKKATYEAAGYASELAGKLGVELHAIVLGTIGGDEVAKLGTYGVAKAHKITDAAFDAFSDQGYTRAIAEVAKAIGAKSVIFTQSYNAKSVAPRVAARLGAAMVSGAATNPTVEGDSLVIVRGVNSGKGIETVRTKRPVSVISVKMNSYGLKENAKSTAIETFAFQSQASDFGAKSLQVVKTANKISITEADIVLSGGRGFKGPENWHLLEKIADLVGAGTACSKPVADMDWRPHHEHVGQTGIQIAPNLYIAIGISGAIQHLAGVNSSKNIVVINKDPEAPFFKIADYGIVGDLFEVLPKITAAIEKAKAAHA
jgi:electron transfer flavoprotein alpha subunit